ncbi:MAG: TetR/AcrR family transcriptional regulator [Caldilineaceae bacterium]
MARTVNQEEYTAKRNQILDAAQLLVLTKGYERMTLQDIRSQLQISSGAFYHYFDSKQAVLDAFIERIQQETEKPLLPILQDPQLSAIQKLQGFFDTLDRLRMSHREDVVKLARVWYTDENAVIRQKVDEAIVKQRAPLLNEIVRQGIGEGVFATAYPEQAGEIILSLLHGMGNTHARLLFSPEQDEIDVSTRVGRIVATHAAYMDAIEQVLGAPAHSLYRAEPEAVHGWLAAASGDA